MNYPLLSSRGLRKIKIATGRIRMDNNSLNHCNESYLKELITFGWNISNLMKIILKSEKLEIQDSLKA